MFEKDKECTAHALESWANWIETGDILLSREDVIVMLDQFAKMPEGTKPVGTNFMPLNHSEKELRKKLKPLGDEQKEFVLRLRKLAKKELSK